MPATARSAVVVPSPSAGVRDRALFNNFLRRELTTRYLGSVTGLAWAFVHPLVLLVVYHFVFTTVFRTERFGNEDTYVLVSVLTSAPSSSRSSATVSSMCIGGSTLTTTA